MKEVPELHSFTFIVSFSFFNQEFISFKIYCLFPVVCACVCGARKWGRHTTPALGKAFVVLIPVRFHNALSLPFSAPSRECLSTWPFRPLIWFRGPHPCAFSQCSVLTLFLCILGMPLHLTLSTSHLISWSSSLCVFTMLCPYPFLCILGMPLHLTLSTSHLIFAPSGPLFIASSANCNSAPVFFVFQTSSHELSYLIAAVFSCTLYRAWSPNILILPVKSMAEEGYTLESHIHLTYYWAESVWVLWGARATVIRCKPHLLVLLSFWLYIFS